VFIFTQRRAFHQFFPDVCISRPGMDTGHLKNRFVSLRVAPYPGVWVVMDGAAWNRRMQVECF
jgi:hypothetical protein